MALVLSNLRQLGLHQGKKGRYCPDDLVQMRRESLGSNVWRNVHDISEDRWFPPTKPIVGLDLPISSQPQFEPDSWLSLEQF